MWHTSYFWIPLIKLYWGHVLYVTMVSIACTVCSVFLQCCLLSPFSFTQLFLCCLEEWCHFSLNVNSLFFSWTFHPLLYSRVASNQCSLGVLRTFNIYCHRLFSRHQYSSDHLPKTKSYFFSKLNWIKQMLAFNFHFIKQERKINVLMSQVDKEIRFLLLLLLISILFKGAFGSKCEIKA